MRFRIEHSTRFIYDRPVFLEPMVVRLRPRADPHQQLEVFTLTFEPAAAGSNETEDAEGNVVTHAWFSGTTERLTITSSFVVETLRENPFDFVVLDALRVPMSYTQEEDAALARFLGATGEVDGFARTVLDASGGEALRFLDELMNRIHVQVSYEIRDEGDPHPAAHTLAAGIGSCRDHAVLFIEACRSVGLAARFVSGYQHGSGAETNMHAWAEVYLPGAGWRGYDPAFGLAVADEHIAVAAAPEPSGAAPTSGSFRGTGARARLDAHIEIATL